MGLKIFYIPPEKFLVCGGAHPTQSHTPTPCYPTHAFPHIPTHIPQCFSCNFTPPTPHHPPIPPPQPTHTFPCIPRHIPQCLSCYFIPPTPPHTTLAHTPHPTPATHGFPHPFPTLHLNIFKVKGVVGPLKNFYTHPLLPHPCLPTYPSMFVMQLHTTHPTSPTHPTHTFPCIPTHIPQCLSCYFTPPIHLCLPMHLYTYPPMFVMLLHTTYPTQAHTPHTTPATHGFPHIPALPYT